MADLLNLANQINSSQDNQSEEESFGHSIDGTDEASASESSLLNSVEGTVKNDYISNETRAGKKSKINYINDLNNTDPLKTKNSKTEKMPSMVGDVDASDFQSSGNDINVGNYSGSVVGSVPIFSSYFKMPFSAYAKNRKALIDSKYAALAGEEPIKLEEISTDPNYDEEFRNKYVNEASLLARKYSKKDLNDIRTEGGKAWFLLNQNYKAKAGKIDNAVKMANDIKKDMASGKSYIPVEAATAANNIIMGMSHPYSTIPGMSSLNEDMKKLSKSRSMESILNQVIPKIEREAVEEYFNGGTFTDKEALDAMKDSRYQTIYASKLKSYYSPEMSKQLALSLAKDNPSSIYVDEIWGGDYDANGNKIMIPNPEAKTIQPFSYKDVSDYIYNVVGATQEKTNFLQASKSSPSTHVSVNNVPPDKKTGDYDWTAKTMQELYSNGKAQIGNANIYSGQDGTVSIDENGRIQISSWSDPLGVASNIHSVASGQQNIVDQNQAIFNSNVYDATLPYGAQFKITTNPQSPPISASVPTSNKSKIDAVVTAVGVLPITQNVNINGFVGTDKEFSFTMNTKDKDDTQFNQTEGVIIPATMVTNPSDKITYISDGKYIVYPNARYVDKGNGVYGIETKDAGKWSDLQPFKNGSHVLQIPKTIVDGMLTGKYKEVSSIINKSYNTPQTVKSSNAVNSGTGGKTQGITDYKKVTFGSYDDLANSFIKTPNGKFNLPTTYKPMLTGFMNAMKGYPASSFTDKNEFAQKFTEWKNTLTEEDYRNLLNSPSADVDVLYKFMTAK